MNSAKILITSLIILIILVFAWAWWLVDSGRGIQQFLSRIETVLDNKSIQGETAKLRVSHVIDGDTIATTNGLTIRYLNIDAPEINSESGQNMCYGKEAREFNAYLVNNQEVILRFDKERTDRYGRTLAFVFLPDIDTTNIENSLNAKLIQGGFARSVFYTPNTTYKRFFSGEERKAKERKLGMWQSCKNPFIE